MIYEPAEDSFLLLKHIDFSGLKVLDMGTGSGILALKAAELGNDVTAVDINTEVIDHMRQYPEIKTIQSNLFENVKGTFDVIMFNSPYLPTENEDVIWDGGPSGREVIERFARGFSEHLNEDGKVLMIISSLTGLDETLELFKDFDARLIDSVKIPWEELQLIEIKK